EELNRVIPILKKLRPKTNLKISLDTYKSEVARQALELGADMINDVTALRADPKMANIIAQHKCPIILMYSKDSTPRTTTKDKKYSDVIKTIKTFLTQRISYAKKHGIHPSQIIIDPGMGQFISNLPKYSYEIIARLSELKSLKAQILLGHSRKSFLQVPMNKRDLLSQPLSAIASIQGASIIRTHDVKGTYKCLNSL
ncbi:MAG: dihydropteroate synthase, partial [Candidatus Peregrinibacteria bacterium]